MIEKQIWKKNCPFLYDLVMTHALEWPSLTVEWLPGSTTAYVSHLSFSLSDCERAHVRNVSFLPHRSDNSNYTEQQVILGTHTSDGEQNHLMLATVRLPHIDQEIDARQYNDENDEVGGFAGAGKIQVKVNNL